MSQKQSKKSNKDLVLQFTNFLKFKNSGRLIFISCGSSWHASLLGEYFFEELARIPVEVEYASEFRYRNPIIKENDIGGIIIGNPINMDGTTGPSSQSVRDMAKNISKNLILIQMKLLF